MLTNEFWWTAFWVTMLITVVTVAVELVLGMGLALVMHRTLVGRGIVRTVGADPVRHRHGRRRVLLAVRLDARHRLPGRTCFRGGAPLTERASSLAIIILAEIWKTTPFMALLLMAGLALVPEDLLKAAAMDGATAWQRFTKVMLPVMKPAILVALLFRTLDAFRIFDNIFVLTAGAHETSSVSMLAYNNLIRGLNLGIGSTMSVLIFITVAIIAFVFVKLFGTAAPGQRRRGEALMAAREPTTGRRSCAGALLDVLVVVVRAGPGAVDRLAVVQDPGDPHRRQLHPRRVDAGELQDHLRHRRSSPGRWSTRSASR